MFCLGAFIGDTSGSKYEFHPYQGEYKDIDIIGNKTRMTDDSILTTATMDWLISGDLSEEKIADLYRKYARLYPRAGYGHLFYHWAEQDNAPSYGSFGNGAGMRVSPIGFWAENIEECLKLAEISASPTHNSTEGIKGAQAVSIAVFLAKQRKPKEEIKEYIKKKFGYDLNRKVDEIKGIHKFDATCQVTVPEAIICFLESDSFADCVRKSIWIGGDVDTIGAMACPIAEAYYGIPYQYQIEMMRMMDDKILGVLFDFNNLLTSRAWRSR